MTKLCLTVVSNDLALGNKWKPLSHLFIVSEISDCQLKHRMMQGSRKLNFSLICSTTYSSTQEYIIEDILISDFFRSHLIYPWQFLIIILHLLFPCHLIEEM